MDDIFKKLFTYKLVIYVLVFIIFMIILNHFFYNASWYNWVTAMLTSIVASFLVGAFFQFSIKDDISKDHKSIMDYLNEKNSSGIIKYYGNFGDSIEDIKKEFLKSKKVDIYLTYGYTILNNLSDSINFNLTLKENEINIFLMNEKNPFISSLAKFWYGNDDSEKLINKINDSTRLIKNKYKELKNRNALNGKINLYSNVKSPVNYSFYLFDNKIFFIPSKNITTKEFTPITILAQKTSVENSLFRKVSEELSRMKEDNCFIEINLDEE